MAVAFVQWAGQQVFKFALGSEEEEGEEEDEQYVDLQCGRTLFTRVPRQMRTELWLSQLHHDQPSVRAAKQFRQYLERVGRGGNGEG